MELRKSTLTSCVNIMTSFGAAFPTAPEAEALLAEQALYLERVSNNIILDMLTTTT